MTDDELNPERAKAFRWTAASVASGLAAAVLAFPLAWPIGMAEAGGGIDIHWWRATLAYLADLPARPDYWIVRHWQWFSGSETLPWPLALPFAIAGLGIGVLLLANPHRFGLTSHGSARLAVKADLARAQLFDRCGFVFGRWGTHPSRGPLIRAYECLSMGVISPPGTGKTVLLMANVLADHPDEGVRTPGPSMIVNDPKGEMFRTTAGWRSRLGPVFRVAWGEADGTRWNPLSARNFPGGLKAQGLRLDIMTTLERLYRRPLAAFAQLFVELRDQDDWRRRILTEPSCLGALLDNADRSALKGPLAAALDKAVELSIVYSEREKIIDSSCTVMVSDKVGVHWCTNGRAALAGFMLYEMARAEREGREPTIGRMLDWLAGATVGGAFTRNLAEIKRPEGDGFVDANPDLAAAAEYLGATPETATGGDVDKDRVSKLLNEAIEEAKRYGYPARVENELRGLDMKPEKERGSVISTAGGALGIFKNAAVRRATSRSDFSFDDLRGAFRSDLNPRGFPVTVYIVTKLKDAESLGLVTGLLIDQAAGYLISQDDSEVRKSMRPVWILADEFWTLPKGMTSIPQIPALGRSYWVALMLVGQSWGQVAIQLGRDAVDVLKGALNYTVMFTQNDRASADDASKTIGNATIVSKSVSRSHGIGANVNPFSSNVNSSVVSHPLMRTEDIMSMEKLDPPKRTWGKLLFLNVGMKNKPIVCRPPIWFKDRTMNRRAGLAIEDWPPLATVAVSRGGKDTIAAESSRALDRKEDAA